MAHILTIQSHVVHGHAGNAAAVFPMQRLGHQVSSLNLLQFSNHTGYKTWGGSSLSLKELEDLIQGLKKLGILTQIDALITGYMASVEQSQAIYSFIAELKQQRPELIYCCDPVMGDEGRGLYVTPEVANFIQSRLIELADWITPNAFELSQLVQSLIPDRESALQAATSILKRFPQLRGVLATSIANTKENTGLLLVTRKYAYQCETPKYTLIPTVHGTGDVAAAIFISHLLNGDDPVAAMQKIANTLHEITHYTHQHCLAELAIVQAQQAIVEPKAIFHASLVG